MVYCGKPSAGCSECRKRKTRCDRAAPSCGQCIRARRTCPGYRNQLDLMFRNESEAVKVKAVKSKETSQTRSKTPAQSRSPTQSYREGSDDDFDQGEEVARSPGVQQAIGEMFSTMNVVPIHSIFPTLEEKSLGAFGTMAPTWFQSFDFVGILCGSSSPEAHIMAGISAVGLASLSNASRAPELAAESRRGYVKALRLTNEALRSPTAVKKDSTLFSVMVLSLYEMISGNNERSLDSWAEHIKGAAALVKIRGQEQFKNLTGQRMFLQVTSNLILSCIQRTLPMPQHIIQLREEAEHSIDTDSPAWRVSGIIIDFTIFRSKVKDFELVGTRDVIEQALEIDQRFVGEFKNLPEEWMYKTVHTKENPHLVWNGSYHVYGEYLISHIWNGMRTCRILLHEIIREQLLSDSTSFTPLFTMDEYAIQLDASTKVMLEMQSDILASVPHHTPSMLSQSSASVLDGSRSYFVLWPLFLVGSMDLTTDPIRMWASARLRNIGESMGIRQAVVISDILTRRVLPIGWDTKLDSREISHRQKIQNFWRGEKSGGFIEETALEDVSLTFEPEAVHF
ncbi:hypothetical protein VTL71DRAFT_8961 [Oculimacula yallundae]|uniref:Zn(2)-C6 fungal-type domain-containing protein n=1 Tax=Oculimacula yallundae TaxID=86028 RepID=A0ABR4BTF0_9HELO